MRRAVSLKDILLVEWAVAVTHGPHTFGVVAYPERVNEWRASLVMRDAKARGFKAAFVHWLKTLIAAWAVTEGGEPVPVSEETIARLSSGARWSIFKAIVEGSRQLRPKGQTEEEANEVMRMSIELSNLQENLYDTARVPVVFKDGDSVEAEELTIEHRAIDLELYDELQAMRNDESGSPLSARHLAHLDARIKDLTDNGSAVASFPVEFWAGLKPALREKIISAVTENVPSDVLFALAKRAADATAPEKDESNVERKDDAQEPVGDSHADAGDRQPGQ